MKKIIIVAIIAIVIGITIVASGQMSQTDQMVSESSIEETEIDTEREGQHFTVGITETVGIEEP